MIDWLCDQCAHLPVADLGGDPPFIFGGSHEGVNNHRGDKVEGHAVASVCSERRVSWRVRCEYGVPKSDGREEWDDCYETAQKDVPAVDKGVLKAETERCGESGWGHGVLDQKIWMCAFLRRRSMNTRCCSARSTSESFCRIFSRSSSSSFMVPRGLVSCAYKR